jgi:hypothetical protein
MRTRLAQISLGRDEKESKQNVACSSAWGSSPMQTNFRASSPAASSSASRSPARRLTLAMLFDEPTSALTPR